MNLFLFLLISAIYTVSVTLCFERKLITVLNPGCPDEICDKKPNYLVYTRSIAKDNVLHYLIGGGVALGPMSVLMISSNDIDSILKIDWHKIMSKNVTERTGAITLKNGKVVSSHAVVFTRLLEYNDTTKMAYIPPQSTQVVAWPISFLQWDDVEKATGWGGVEANNRAVFTASTVSEAPPSPINATLDIDSDGTAKLFQSNGSVTFEFTHFATYQHSSQAPSLIFTGNNTQIDLRLNHLVNTWKNSRYALEIAMVTSRPLGVTKNVANKMMVELTKSVDDEYTPGIFALLDLLAQPVDAPWTQSSYLQWKPVCYFDEVIRYLKTSTPVNNSAPVPPPMTDFLNVEVEVEEFPELESGVLTLLESSLAGAWFGMPVVSSPQHTNMINVTFGGEADGFYRIKNFTAWTSTFGYGSAPREQFSIGVIMVVICGLGLPFILIVLGGVYVFFKKKSMASDSSYQPINT